MKYVFHTCVLNPNQIAMLSLSDKNHLTNMTQAWIEQNEESVNSIKGLIAPLVCSLLGGLLFILSIYDVLVAGNSSVDKPFIFFGTILLTLALLNSKRIRMRRSQRVAKQLGTIGAAQKPICLFLLKELSSRVLTPQAQSLVKSGKWAARRRQGILALLWTILTILTYLSYLQYNSHSGYIPGLSVLVILVNHPGIAVQDAETIFILFGYLLLIPPAVFITLFLKKTDELFGIRIPVLEFFRMIFGAVFREVTSWYS